MKKQDFNKKLVLNKKTISNLDMSGAKGGVIELTYYGTNTGETCNVCSDPPNECDSEQICGPSATVGCVTTIDSCDAVSCTTM